MMCDGSIHYSNFMLNKPESINLGTSQCEGQSNNHITEQRFSETIRIRTFNM